MRRKHSENCVDFCYWHFFSTYFFLHRSLLKRVVICLCCKQKLKSWKNEKKKPNNAFQNVNFCFCFSHLSKLGFVQFQFGDSLKSNKVEEWLLILIAKWDLHIWLNIQVLIWKLNWYLTTSYSLAKLLWVFVGTLRLNTLCY